VHNVDGSIKYDYIKTTDNYYVAGRRYYKKNESTGNYSLLTAADKSALFINLTATSTYDSTTYYYYKDFSETAASTKDYYLSKLTKDDFNYIIKNGSYVNYCKLDSTKWTK